MVKQKAIEQVYEWYESRDTGKVLLAFGHYQDKSIILDTTELNQ